MMSIHVRSLLSRSSVVVQQFLQDTAENAVRAVAGWAKGVAILYGIGAALVLVALFALANTLAWGVVELGLPPYAAWLILTVVTGGVGYALFKAGSKKGVTHADVDDRPGLSFRIVKPRSRRRTPVYDVHRDGSAWEVTKGGSSIRSFRSKTKAVNAARRAARSSSGRVVIHRN